MDSSAQWTSQELGEVGKLCMGGESREINSRKVMTSRPQKEQIMALNCPRCHSTNTKFCYYNNYSLSQPRYFCKTCRRYWTEGGTLRNVPVGGGSRKNKRYSTKHLPDLNPKLVHEELHHAPTPQFPKMERSMHATSSSLGLDFLRSSAGCSFLNNNIPTAAAGGGGILMGNGITANIYASNFEECKLPAEEEDYMFALGSKRINDQHKQNNPNAAGLLFWNIGTLGGAAGQASSPW